MKIPVPVRMLALQWKGISEQKEVSIRPVSSRESWTSATEEDFSPTTRSMKELKAAGALAAKRMRAGLRAGRTKRSRTFNTALRKRGVDPAKFRALTKKNHGLTAKDFEKLVWLHCRLEK